MKTIHPEIAIVAALVLIILSPGLSSAQSWDFSLNGQIGLPQGYVKVGEASVQGTRLRLRGDLGIDVSEAASGSLAYGVTPEDTFRLDFLQYFLRGSRTVRHPIVYNGEVFGPGTVRSTLDFYHVGVAYERGLWDFAGGARLLGRAGLRYVHLDAVVHGNHEDFYRQELPVPVGGLRLLYPIGPRLALTADVAGGGLPRVDSLRREGGTVYLSQSHADADLGIRYALTSLLGLTAGYRFTYFFQHEHSREDDNRIKLIDNAARVGLDIRF